MEAQEYFSTYDAIHEEGRSIGRLNLNVKETCGINKILWSSFDFMTGPELRFVWELVSRSSISPVNLSGEEGSVNDAESLDSSLSVQSAQYEDIDDPLQGDLSTVDMMDSMLLSDSAYHFFTSSPIGDRSVAYNDDYMTESRSTTTLTNTTVGMEDSRIMNSLTSSGEHIASNSTNDLRFSSEQGSSSDTTQASPSSHDVLSSTPLDGMDMSRLLAGGSGTQLVEEDSNANRLADEGVQDSIDDEASFARLPQLEGNMETKSEIDSDVKKPIDSALTTSCVDSGIAGTISMHSDLSAQCMTPDRYQSSASQNPILTASSRSSPTGDDLVSLLDVSLDSPDDPLSDEVFVSKFVLAEQICSTQLSSNPLMHKLTMVPSRQLLVSSFIFSSESDKGRQSLHAVSFLLNCSRCDWFMARESFFEMVFMDSVPRIKAVLYTEDWDDVVVRATSELTSFMETLGALDRFPLISPTRPLMIKNTLLASRRCQQDGILSRAISGVLQSQGHCVIVGSDHQYVSKLLSTLALFVPEQWRWCALRSFRHRYNPYVRLQAIRRCDVPRVVQSGVWAVWPICVVDVDKATVCMSAPFRRHRVVRKRAEMNRIRLILEQHEDTLDTSVKLELSSCRVLDCVKNFLRQMDYLPMEESCRVGFVNQLLLYVENMALAFIQYVKDASQPLPTEKSSPVKSSRFSLSECRKALDLQSDSWFHAVLAAAEVIRPDIADFICMA